MIYMVSMLYCLFMPYMCYICIHVCNILMLDKGITRGHIYSIRASDVRGANKNKIRGMLLVYVRKSMIPKVWVGSFTLVSISKKSERVLNPRVRNNNETSVPQLPPFHFNILVFFYNSMICIPICFEPGLEGKGISGDTKDRQAGLVG